MVCLAFGMMDRKFGFVYLLFYLVHLAFGMVDLAGTIQIVTPALVTLPLIFELLRVNCRDLLSL